MKENTLATNFEPHEYVIFVQSTKIGTNENKAIHSNIIWFNPICSNGSKCSNYYKRVATALQSIAKIE